MHAIYGGYNAQRLLFLLNLAATEKGKGKIIESSMVWVTMWPLIVSIADTPEEYKRAHS